VGASGRISHNAVPININKISDKIPDKFALGQNYPNPFNNQTKFTISIPERKTVEIKIYDISGKLVKVLLNSELQSGVYDITVNTDGLTSGIYYYNLFTGNFSETKKFVLLK
ncbi:MAG: T9SS type A sorting domain-containing protein, partial [Ignavibacteria bacterium]|nr:T9SS type A sorting domain-containing protein [Ignavibacteria bacterium]